MLPDLAEGGPLPGAKLPRYDDALVGQEGFTGDAGVRFQAEKFVEEGIGNAIGELIGMTLGDGFRGKQTVMGCHDVLRFSRIRRQVGVGKREQIPPARAVGESRRRGVGRG